VTRRLRFRFSLMTTLIAVAWSAVVVWGNLIPRFGETWYPLTRPSIGPCLDVAYGLPWKYVETCLPRDYDWSLLSRDEPSRIDSYAALSGDIAVGLLLVVVLTWGSNQLLRRLGRRLRRRIAAKEQP
jgi:hypothetical protein